VETAKKALFEQEQVLRAQDGFLARRLAQQAQYGWIMARDAELDRKISALTATEVSAAVKRHIQPALISCFKSGDFKKAAQ
jgi:zinc protease